MPAANKKSPSRRLQWKLAVRDSDLSSTDRLVAYTLALRMNPHGGSCFPSLELLARETGLHRSTVHASIQRLEQAHFLTVRHPNVSRHETGEIRRRAQGRSGYSNDYVARFPNETVAHDERSRTTTVAVTPTVVLADDNGRSPRIEPSSQATRISQGEFVRELVSPFFGDPQIPKTEKDLWEPLVAEMSKHHGDLAIELAEILRAEKYPPQIASTSDAGLFVERAKRLRNERQAGAA